MRRRTLLSASSGGIDIDPTTGRGTIGSYEVVDLGLSNGLLFAACNVGATKETEYGNYYQWGAGSATYQNKNQYHTGGTDSSYTLPSSADTATQVMGEGWRMPTENEYSDFLTKTDFEWVTDFNGSGINGGKFTSKTNPNAYVFFPAANYYDYDGRIFNVNSGFIWSSTSVNTNYAYLLQVHIKNHIIRGDYIRHHGNSVRGVHAAV